MRVIRASGIVVGLLFLSLGFIPLQWAALRFNLPWKKSLPVGFARSLCALFGIRVETFGRPCREPGVLLAVNHTSYFDMPVLAAVIPLAFVAKAEVANWAFFGILSKLVGTVFVERERRSRAGAQRDQIKERLESGGTIVLFPEGTSNDGNRVLDFKSSLMGSADAMVNLPDGTKRRVLVQPVSLAYTRLHGVPMGRELRPFFAWYGDMELVPHLWAAAGLGPVDAMVHYHPPVTLDQFKSRKELTAECERLVALGVSHALAGRPGPAAPAYQDEPLALPPIQDELGDGLRADPA